MKNINDISTYPSDYNWLSEEQQDKIVTILNARQKIADEYWTLCKDIYENEESIFCTITIQLSSKVLTQKRTYAKLIDVLGDVGGLMEILYTVLNIISSLVTEVLYDKSLVNSLSLFFK